MVARRSIDSAGVPSLCITAALRGGELEAFAVLEEDADELEAVRHTMMKVGDLDPDSICPTPTRWWMRRSAYIEEQRA